MRQLAMGLIASLAVAAPVFSQSLVELAKAEAERRESVRERRESSSGENDELDRTQSSRRSTAPVVAPSKASATGVVDQTPASKTVEDAGTGEESLEPGRALAGATVSRSTPSMMETVTVEPPPVLTPVEETPGPRPASASLGLVPESVESVKPGPVAPEPEGTGSAPVQRVRRAGTQPQVMITRPQRLAGRRTSSDLFDGAVYLDWFRVGYDDGFSTSQLSTRLKMQTGKSPGTGWRFFIDARHRYRSGASSRSRILLYDARFIFDDAQSAFQASVGQMNLYDTAGAGQLAGAQVGYKLSPSWTLGGYGGLEPDIYATSYDFGYLKYGAFANLRGSGAKSMSVSYNRLRFDGASEREYVFANGLLPVHDAAVVFGSVQYELGDGVLSEDRLSQLFLNTRYNVSSTVDVTGFYSTGRGLDFHQFLVEQSKNPDRNSPELERFYFSQTYGVRLTVRPRRNLRLFVAQRESEQRDKLTTNHTTQIGASTFNVFGSGVGLYGTYNINRGDLSENDSYRLSVSRAFGRVSWTGYYSSTFNGVRLNGTTGLPELVRVVDRNTFSNDFFIQLTEALAISLQHDFSSRGDDKENTLFFRTMYRF